MGDIFISYRRDDTAGWAGRLSTDLQEQLEEAVFQDIGAIAAGEDFVDAIERSLESCSAVLVLIGPDWSLIKDKAGTRRLDNPEDTVRLEIARALARKDRLVIPVLVGGAEMPSADELPPELKALVRRNAFELSDTRWNYDLKQLVATLIEKGGFTPKVPPVPPLDKPSTKSVLLRSLGWLAALAGLAVLASIGYFFMSPHATQPQAISCGRGSGTVFIQYTDSSLKDKAAVLMSVLNEAGYKTPGTQLEASQKIKHTVEIRYFSVPDIKQAKELADQAEILRCILKKEGYSPIINQMTNLTSPNLEIWLSKSD